MRHLVTFLAALLLPVLSAQAQTDQIEKIQRLNARYDAQVRAGFVGDEKLLAAMQADLKALDALKDSSARTAAIAAYQRKYSKAYQAVLARGKVDLAAWAAALSAITGWRYTVQDGTHLVATASDTRDDRPAPATKTTEQLRASDYTLERDVSCSLIGLGGVVLSDLNLTSNAWAADAGGCSSKGVLYHELTVPEDKTVLIGISADMPVELSAVGIYGAARSTGLSSFSLRREGATYDILHQAFYCETFAPMFWAASRTCGETNTRKSMPEAIRSGQYTIRATTQTDAYAGGYVATTSATAKVHNLSVRITLEPR